MAEKKKKKGLVKGICLIAGGVVLAAALGTAQYFATIYEGLLDVFFATSSYSMTEAEAACAEQVVDEGAVLLKNEDSLLPLTPSIHKKVALFGQNSVDFVYGGSGSGEVDSSSAPTLKDALEEVGYTVNSTLWDFYDTGAGSSYRKKMPGNDGSGYFAVNEVPQSVYTSEVLNSLNDDFAICVIGRSGGESSDLPRDELDTGYLYLEPDGDELAMIKLACENYSNVILLVNANNPMELGILEDSEYSNVKAALWCGGVGQVGMHGLANIISGAVSPSGRLADTYAYDSSSAPSYQNLGDYSFTNSEVTNGTKYMVYQEGIYIGYRYYETRYEDVILSQGNAGSFDYDSTVQFPFGYGLSYTDFSYSDYSVSYDSASDSFTAKVSVTNTGSVAGKEVVQLYGQSPYTEYDKTNGVEKASVVLLAYGKTDTLEPGASEELTLTFDKRQLASYDYTNAKTYILDEGTYYFGVGKNSHDALNNILAKKNALSGGDATLVETYEQASFDSTTYSVSPVNSEVEITNQFDDVDANYYDECTYLTRSDWTGTYPDGPYKGGSWEASAELLADLEFYDDADEVVNDGSTMPTWNSTSTSYTVQDLVEADYDDSRWDDIVNQLSYNQATRLIRLGGYATIQIDAIGLPKTQDKDGPSGISGTLVGGTSCMAWPVEVVFASTFNDALMEDVGEFLGEDSISAGVAGWYAPGVNIHRSPYSGRNFEYFSEDGLLSGKIGAAEMRGVRSKGVIAYMKHFALNDQETNRGGGAMFANEQYIREISTKGFEWITLEGNPNAAMAGMNRIGARWVGAHKGMMTSLLRDEWGFEGMVITDQASVTAMFYQDMISGLWAGTDMWLNTNSSFWSLADYEDNATVNNHIHRAAKNIIYAVTKSNAVINYESGGTNEASSGWALWKILWTVGESIGFAGAAVLVFFGTWSLVKANKQKPESEQE